MVKVKEKKNVEKTTTRPIKGTNKHETDANDDKVYFMALGGLEHIGQNMYLYYLWQQPMSHIDHLDQFRDYEY